MLPRIVTLAAICVMLFTQALADAPLKTRLDLDTDQAKAVAEIQAKHRAEMRGERGDLNRESRAFRRARTANDSEQIEKLEKTVAELQKKVAQRILAEDAEIRKVLNPDQLVKFEAYIEERNDMAGSSRDVRALKPKS